jgi:hypothetical protein
MRCTVLATAFIGAFAGLFLLTDDVALVIAAAAVGGAWVRLVPLGDGERELQRSSGAGPPLLDPSDRSDT